MVTMKFNLVNFVLETTSILLLLAVKSDVIRILYLLVRYIYLYIFYLLIYHCWLATAAPRWSTT